MDNSKENILKRIAAVRRQTNAAISFEMATNAEIYKPVLPDQISCFKNELETVSGKCILVNGKSRLVTELRLILNELNIRQIYCRDKVIKSFLEEHSFSVTNQPDDFEAMQAGITGCEYLVARTGSVLVTSNGDSGRQMNVFPPVHIVLANKNQLVDFPEDALLALKEKYEDNLPSEITFITGPSRTADIEKTLVLGAHGPKEFIVFLLVE